MASSQHHRPAVNVALSPASYAKQKLNRVVNLETQLANLPKQTKSEDQASRLRIQMCEVLSDILLTDPQFSLDNDCIGRLWRNCFYGPIGVLRQRITRAKRKKDGSLAKLENSLSRFLLEAIALYEYLVSRYHSKLLGESNNFTMTQQSSQGSSSQSSSQATIIDPATADSQPAPSTNPEGVVRVLFRMYIHLGDLHRYKVEYGKASKYYEKASKLAPGVGNPYNQIAVVAQLKDAAAPLNCVALYWYARSLLTTHEPFEISRANLARLFQSNRDWFQKQPPPPSDVLKPADGNGGRDMVKAQRSKASQHFLSQFVDLHFSFFQGTNPTGATTTTTTTTTTKENKLLLSDEDVVQQMEDLLGPLSVLLKASAFGDSLLCKMVAICAFSEAYSPNVLASSSGDQANKDAARATAMLSRMFTLAFGACLAERTAVGLAKIKDQPEKMGNPGKAPPSVRLVLPLLLVCEFVESRPINLENSEHLSVLSTTARAFLGKTIENFWQNVAEVINTLTHLRGAMDLDCENWRNARLKEYDNLLGYSPFNDFLEDSMAGSREDGFASVEEAINVLELNMSQTQDASQLTSTQDSTMSSTPATVEEYKTKVARFLAFGDRVAESTEGMASRFERGTDGVYTWKEKDSHVDAMDDDYDDDNPMMDAENVEEKDGTQPREDDNGDVLVYKAPEGGGPALLVPGQLLQNRNLPPNESSDERMPDVSIAPPPAAAANLGNPPPLAMHLNAGPSSVALEEATPAAAPRPPPGFSGMGSAVGQQRSLPRPGETSGAMPFGFGQGLRPGFHQQATIADSLHMFGGQAALQTGNPFAAGSMPNVSNDVIGLNFGVVNGGSASNGVGNGSSFLHQDSSGAAESSLIGSGLLTSLFMDDGNDNKTKNPFAT